ncbi:hypothetical protein KIPB_012027, partial [Kipferlia bialata]|eukprot:g12027.t1
MISTHPASVLKGRFKMQDGVHAGGPGRGLRQREAGSNSGLTTRPRKRTRGAATPRDYRDEQNHYQPVDGELIKGQYRVHTLLGKGTFGKVLGCYDTVNDMEVALKII